MPDTQGISWVSARQEAIDTMKQMTDSDLYYTLKDVLEARKIEAYQPSAEEDGSATVHAKLVVTRHIFCAY